MILEGAAHEGALRLATGTAVVGSGAGGAVVARTLAEAGERVAVLEEGGYHLARDFTQREDEMMRKLFRDGGMQTTADGLVTVLQGSTWGGSTVINMADCEPTPAPVYAHWHRLLGIDEISEEALAPSVERVFERLRVHRIPDRDVNPNNRAALDGARRLGWRAGTFRHNRTGCVGSGYCLIGCAYDAKQGAHLTYLPDAVAAGAEVVTDARAERIEVVSGRRLRVHGSLVERGTRRRRHLFSVEARRVVLAAGAVHSPALLHRSGLGRGLPQLGRNLSLQPQMPVIARFDGEEAVRAWRGIPQSTFVDQFDDHRSEHGLGGFRLEPVFGGMAQLGAGAPGFGHAHKAAMADAARTAMGLLLVPDRPSGSITWRFDPERGFRPRIRYRLRGEWIARLREGLRRSAELYFAAGARSFAAGSELLPPLRGPEDLWRIDGLPIRTGVTRFISAHVQGTCRMSRDARSGVVDTDHRLHTHPGIYVVDASVMPTTASTHTMVPIMALADRAARRMVGA